MMFEQPLAGRHLHRPERSKRVHALGVASINAFDALLDFFTEGCIESLGVRFVVNLGNEVLMDPYHLLHGKLPDGLFEFSVATLTGLS